MEKLNKIELLYNRVYFYLFVEKIFKKKIKFNFEKNIYRWDLILKILKTKKYQSYLEIGCDDNLLFSKINIRNKVGIDPVSGGTIRKYSDDFFKTNKKTFDLIFIDGLHTYDQVKKDISNSLKILNRGGLILLHDCLPCSQSHQAVPRFRGLWNGDVWKAITEYRTKKNLNICTILIDQGISVIKKNKNKQLLKLSVKNFKKLTFKDFYYNYINFMNIITYKEYFKFFFIR